MVFDPDQNPEEKRAVRQNYRSLAKKIEGVPIICYPLQYNYIENQGGPNDFTAEELLSQVQKADKLFDRGNQDVLPIISTYLMIIQSRGPKKLPWIRIYC